MARTYPCKARRTHLHVFAWAALCVTTLLLASLLQALVSTAVVEPMPTVPTDVGLSSATAALADGDDVRARSFASVRGKGLDIGSDPSLSH
jgi:hypothetical protein